MKLIKIEDTNSEVTSGSKIESYWNLHGYRKYFEKVRPKLKLPSKLQMNDPNVIADIFNIKGIGFGNWVTAEDRINYLYSLTLSLYDLNKVLGFNYDLGMGLLSITFGARGSGSALAHYEPWSNYINVTRYEKNGFFKQENKMVRFLFTGGMGSLGHEYGHFLDYSVGEHIGSNKPWINALSGGGSVSRKRIWDNNDHPLLVAMDDLMEAIIWKVPGKVESNFYNRLIKQIDNTVKGNYWKQRDELFARFFEAYITSELKLSGIRNLLLSQDKYPSQVYLKPSEIDQLRPFFKKVIRLIKEVRVKR